jgi:hypothetical protein
LSSKNRFAKNLPKASSHDVGGAQRLDITHRWLAEETAVFAIELAHTFVADFVHRACGI